MIGQKRAGIAGIGSPTDAERDHRDDDRQRESVRVTHEPRAVHRQHRAQLVLSRGTQYLECRGRERDRDPHGVSGVLHHRVFCDVIAWSSFATSAAFRTSELAGRRARSNRFGTSH